MKPRIWTSISTVVLFAAIAAPVQLAAQGSQDHNDNPKHHRYKLIDMGTFGGALSGTNFPGDANNKAVNMQGVTVGFSATSTPKLPTSSPFICGGDDGFGSDITHAFRWQNGTVSDLRALSPVETNCSNAYQVNASGEIVGFSENGQVDPLAGFNQSRAVRWKKGEIEDLGSFGGNQNEAISINSRGQIVGLSQNTISSSCVGLNFFPLGTTQLRAFLWEKGSMQDLGTLGGDCAVADYINERGQVAGVSETTTTPNPDTGIPAQDPFLWEDGKMTDLGTLGGAIGFPLFLNNHGQVVGFSSTSTKPGACLTEGDPNCHPFLWKHGNLIDLGTTSFGGSPVTPDGFNDAGAIVGAADFSSTGGSTFDAYLWRNGVATDLGAVSGDCFSRAIAINSHSQVVGNSFSCDGNFHNAFLWENGSIIDLNTLIPANSSLQLSSGNDINDRGEIAGIGVPPGVPPANVFAEGHAYLLIPCDENHPGIEGCDYRMVDASAATFVPPRLRPASGDMPLAVRSHRNNRLRFPAFGHGN